MRNTNSDRAIHSSDATPAAVKKPAIRSVLLKKTERLVLATSNGAEVIKQDIEAAQSLGATVAPDAPESPPKSEFTSSAGLMRASDVTPEPVEWLWPGWLAAGKMHILGGAAGTGKTTIAMALAATVTTGGLWPDGTRSPVGNVVIWSGEDDPADTLIPRLLLSGANLSRVYFVTDLDLLPQKMAELGDVRLLILDPIASAVRGDSHKNAEVRRSLQPLVDLVASMRCALLGITHFSKGTGRRDPLDRLTGSLAFGAMPRVVLVAARQQTGCDDGRTMGIFCRAKSNIGSDQGGFEYDVQPGKLEGHAEIFGSFVVWGNTQEGGARELLAAAESKSDAGEGGPLGEEKSFLAGLLANGPIAVNAIRAEATAAGYSLASIRRAQKAIGVKAHKVGMKGGWHWSIPRRCATRPEDA